MGGSSLRPERHLPDGRSRSVVLCGRSGRREGPAPQRRTPEASGRASGAKRRLDRKKLDSAVFRSGEPRSRLRLFDSALDLDCQLADALGAPRVGKVQSARYGAVRPNVASLAGYRL